MKTSCLYFVFSVSLVLGQAFAQVAKPLAEGTCKYGSSEVEFVLYPETFSLKSLKGSAVKSCSLRILSRIHAVREPMSKVIFQYALSACDRRLSTDKGFSSGPFLTRGSIVFQNELGYQSALLQAVRDEEWYCKVKILDWNKLEKFQPKIE